MVAGMEDPTGDQMPAHQQFNDVFARLLTALQRSFPDSPSVTDLVSRFDLATTFSQSLPLKRYRERVLPHAAQIAKGVDAAGALLASVDFEVSGLGGLDSIWQGASAQSRAVIVAFMNKLSSIAAQ
jgi:hypothetical protein